jgi:hypothetical protein
MVLMGLVCSTLVNLNSPPYLMVLLGLVCPSLVKLNSPPYLMVLIGFVCSTLVCHVRSRSLLFILFSVYFVITCKTFHIDTRLFYHVLVIFIFLLHT